MAKQDWGTKRLCQSCATKFYDFGRTPIVCPKCTTTFDPESLLKARRSRPSSASKAAKAPKPVPAPKPAKDDDEDDEVEAVLEGAGIADLDDNDDEDDSVLQDASDLGGDDVKDVVGPAEKGDGDDDR